MNDLYQRRAEALRILLPKDNITGVEIGVDEGEFSRILLEMYPEIKKIYGVDPYKKSSNSYRSNYSDKKWDQLYSRIKTNMNFGKRFQLIRKISSLAINDIPNNLSFVYIDGDHSYQCVLDDISLYESKVVKGGILCGHDYPAPGKKYPEVVPAVDFYAHTFGRDLKSTSDLEVGMWWWVV